MAKYLAVDCLGDGLEATTLLKQGATRAIAGEALKLQPDRARIPILVVTAKGITAEDHVKLSGYVTTIMEKTEFDHDHFIAEMRRSMSGRGVEA